MKNKIHYSIEAQRDLDEIWDYIDSGEPMDKAGAYGIQGLAGKFVSGTSGDFDTVVGLSLTLLRALIKEVGGEI